jgi:hypothetical protein
MSLVSSQPIWDVGPEVTTLTPLWQRKVSPGWLEVDVTLTKVSDQRFVDTLNPCNAPPGRTLVVVPNRTFSVNSWQSVSGGVQSRSWVQVIKPGTYELTALFLEISTTFAQASGANQLVGLAFDYDETRELVTTRILPGSNFPVGARLRVQPTSKPAYPPPTAEPSVNTLLGYTVSGEPTYALNAGLGQQATNRPQYQSFRGA